MQSLAVLDEADRALAHTENFAEICEIRNKAEAVRRYAQSAALGLDVQNRAAEVKLRAERQAGKLLRQLTLRGGDRRSNKRDQRIKLDDLGITPNQSTRWQIQASVSEEAFGAYVRETCDAAKELTSAGLMRLAKRLREESRARRGDSTEAFEGLASESVGADSEAKFEEAPIPAYLRARTRAHGSTRRFDFRSAESSPIADESVAARVRGRGRIARNRPAAGRCLPDVAGAGGSRATRRFVPAGHRECHVCRARPR